MGSHSIDEMPWEVGGGRLLPVPRLALACLLAPACSRNPNPASGESPESQQEAISEVTLTRVARADISATARRQRDLAALPNQDVRVSSLVPGRVARMMVAEGDQVKAGQVLAKIEDRPFLDQLQQAEAAVEQAKANLENAAPEPRPQREPFPARHRRPQGPGGRPHAGERE